MELKRKYFGTDGIRGTVGEGIINPEFVLKLGWAIGSVLSHRNSNTVLIGKDTRISGYLFESALQAGLAAAGANIYLLGPLPTPGIAFLTKKMQAQAGIVISASHNPYYDNGIKIFAKDGCKLLDEVEYEIEQKLNQPLVMVKPEELGKAKRINDAVAQYATFCKSTLPQHINLTGLKVVVDCANGATYQVAPKLLSELGATVHTLGVTPDGFNINQSCGSTAIAALQKKVIEVQADLGIAFDGDGDRVIMVDHKGQAVDGDEIILIIVNEAIKLGFMQGGVVGTVMSNLGFEIALQQLNVPFIRAKVGDRYVLEQLQRHGWTIGGEQSGHIINLGLSSTGDGLLSALQVLVALHDTGRTLFELKQSMKKFPQIMINVKLSEKFTDTQQEKLQPKVKDALTKLGSRGRVLLRPSGTEPVLRVMVEGENEHLVNQIANELAAEAKHLFALATS